VSPDSFRRYTIIAENAVGIGRQQTVLTERTFTTYDITWSIAEQSRHWL